MSDRKIKLIATDMDGTFLDKNKSYNQARFQQQLQALNHLGCHFVIASGNQYQFLVSCFSGIEGEIDYVAENGALVVAGKQILFEAIIDPVIWRIIVRELQTHASFGDGIIILSGREGAYLPDDLPDEAMKMASSFNNHVIRVPDLCAVSDAIYKIALNWREPDVTEKLNYLNTQYRGNVRATDSGHGDIDIICPGISKAVGLRVLQLLWGISPEETVVFGDSGNDIEMLTAARYSFAMKQAEAEIRAAARYVTEMDNDHEGVLEVIDTIIAQKL